MSGHMRRVAALVLMLAAAVLPLAAATATSPALAQGSPASVAGPWSLAYTTRDGVKMTSTLTLTVEGDKLTGTISSPRGSVPLDEVSVKGTEIAFAIIRVGFGDRIRIEYAGRIKGDTMTLTMKAGEREPIEITAKRGA